MPDDDGAPPPLAPGDARHARSAAALARLLRAVADVEPLVVLVDDAHWIDPASEDCLRAVAESAPATRMLLVANFRPEYDPAWMRGAACHRLALPPLGHDASQALLIELLGADGAVGTLLDRIGAHTAGNPFFIEEVVQALAASGVITGRPGSYRVAASLETLAIPATVHSLVAARIDRLGEPAKHLLQTAAVIGKQFEEELLREVAVDQGDLA